MKKVRVYDNFGNLKFEGDYVDRQKVLPFY